MENGRRRTIDTKKPSETITASSTQVPLRRRMNLLHRAHSLTSLHGTHGATTTNTLKATKDRHLNVPPALYPTEKSRSGHGALTRDDVEDLSSLECQSGSESDSSIDFQKGRPSRESPPGSMKASSSGNEWVQEQRKEPKKGERPRVETSSFIPALERSTSNTSNGPRSPASSKAWYEFDLAVVVALVSPIGNWLTGGDHIKNLLLVFLLIFYLHQIIEIPWALYQKARPRKRGLPFPPSPTDSPEVRYLRLAETELRHLELLFLFLTLISPFLGAFLLRYGTAAVLGPEAVSWFSTGLFVFATGMRPWRHLVDRLNKRTSELHDFVHYPELHRKTVDAGDEKEKEKQDSKRLLVELEGRADKVEKALGKMRKEASRTQDNVETAVSTALKRYEKRWDRCEGRLEAIEGDIRQLYNAASQRKTGSAVYALALSVTELGGSTVNAIRWIWEATYPLKTVPRGTRARSTSGKGPQSPPSSSSSSTPRTPLETILEEELVPSLFEDPSGDRTPRIRPSSRSYIDTAYQYSKPIIVLPLALVHIFCSRVLRIVFFPLKAAARMVFKRYD
ncbi:hypothetical protein FA15DRAFT_754625 [Coprinopsis marcescibilis]|uniref:Uncharacterized protein n=1 Tax=Coprinopsis marcescibilis TaxID=230819 RepID=A0A5C3L1S9_COPMA|nr:hypothetical protein FA15DRAFT_754625 [Coprinopsis marcescibilis]